MLGTTTTTTTAAAAVAAALSTTPHTFTANDPYLFALIPVWPSFTLSFLSLPLNWQMRLKYFSNRSLCALCGLGVEIGGYWGISPNSGRRILLVDGTVTICLHNSYKSPAISKDINLSCMNLGR